MPCYSDRHVRMFSQLVNPELSFTGRVSSLSVYGKVGRATTGVLKSGNSRLIVDLKGVRPLILEPYTMVPISSILIASTLPIRRA